VTTGTGEIVKDKGAESFARDWEQLRADGDIQWQELRQADDIQFTPIEPTEPPEPPDWWKDFIEFLGDLLSPVGDLFAAIGRLLGLSGQVIMWLFIGIAVLAVGLLIFRFVSSGPIRRSKAPEPQVQWTPDSEEAIALLDDADRLAAEGRYDEATHLLLKRSVGQIAAARPGLLEPSSTAREISALPALSQAARGAFGTIAERVERSLFALRSLSADDWQAARAAYAEFALAVPQV
jgi:hypothetical protein